MNKLNPILITATNMTAHAHCDTPAFSVSYFTQQGLEKNKNDDGLLIYPVDEHTLVLAIADGVGSAVHGDKAAFQILSDLKNILDKNVALLEEAYTKNKLEGLRHLILNTIIQTNADIFKMPGYLTTLTLCALHRDTIQVFQIGDSGLILCGQRGKLKYQTTFHSPIGYAVASGLLNNEEANAHPENHFVDNLLGAENANIEMSTPILMATYDSILLATDGLFDNVVIADLIEQIRKGDHVSVSNSLIEMIQTRKNLISNTAFTKDDDISFILCRLNN